MLLPNAEVVRKVSYPNESSHVVWFCCFRLPWLCPNKSPLSYSCLHTCVMPGLLIKSLAFYFKFFICVTKYQLLVHLTSPLVQLCRIRLWMVHLVEEFDLAHSVTRICAHPQSKCMISS